MFGSVFRAIFGTKGERDLKRMLPVVERINAFEPEIRALSDEQLKARTPEFKRRLAESLGCSPAELPLHGEENEGNRLRLREALDAILPEAFAVVRETAWRIIKQRHYDVQLIGGMVLHQGKIAEMKTGEGKTLAATLPVYLNALTGLGVHLVTVNDYLARRDAEWMGPIYRFHGLSVGYILTNMDQDARQAAYASDITYGTNNEFGFDYLRDNMVPHISYKAQRGFYFCIVDEVDSILIDEARTPLIISGPAEESTGKYMEIQRIIPRLSRGVTIGQDLDAQLQKLTDEKSELATRLEMGGEDAEAKARLQEIKKEMGTVNREKQNATINKQLNVPLAGGDFIVEESDRSVFLTPDGIAHLEKLLGIDNLYGAGNIETVHHVEQALKANAIFKLDVDYVVKDGEVIIVDEFTGRLMPGRRYSDGLHQALEAKEGVKVERENQTLATITFQNYFRMYAKLSGMTGTADTEAEEFQKIYKLDVVVIPTNSTIIRLDSADRIYRTEREKNEAIIDEIAELYEKGQPVLVGTISVEKSERLSRQMKSRGIPHSVLNAKFHDKEAEIVADAGRPGKVTIATNMAGRGTDIILGGNPETQGRSYVENVLRNTHRKADETEILEFVRLVRLDQREMLATFQANHPVFDDELLAQVRRLYDQVKAEQQRVLEAGGLFILGTERHEARRIDNQLRGRSGRQGDAGASRFYISMEDDLMRLFGGERLKAIMQRLGMKEGEEIEHPWISRAIANSQKRVESRNFEIRKHLLKYDEVMNEQRTWVYGRRNQVLEQEDLSALVFETIDEVVAARIEEVSENRRGLSSEGLETLRKWIEIDLRIGLDLPEDSDSLAGNLAVFQDNLAEGLKQVYRDREGRIGHENMRSIEKFVLLRTIDSKWKEHLYEMDQLKEGINWRSYAERDPLIEYKFEGFRMFHDMLNRINSEAIELLFHVELAPSEDAPPPPTFFGGRAMHDDVGQFGMLAQREAPRQVEGPGGEAGEARAFRPTTRPQPRQQVVRQTEKVGRNAPCPCGSGKKYKHCCYPKYE